MAASSIVVVGGALALEDTPLLAGIREVVYRRSLPLATRNLEITLAATLEAIIAQRLIRTICPSCPASRRRARSRNGRPSNR